LGLVERYTAEDGAVPAVHKIGGTAWEKTKRKTVKAIEDMTAELIELYAERKVRGGHAFGSDTQWQRELEDAFIYEETYDQLRAIDDIKTDMENATCMDRLLCGDVGFGKTEVAVRAAFLAALSGRQTAVLVPTTVLAQQHYNTFKKRLDGYPVRIAQLSRFLTKQEVKDAIRDLGEGKIDIVVGTHRLLQSDIEFKDLGLLVIDEEQRFGVKHKERMKQMRKTVHCLTLTATPIPRTLQMSLLGIRDLSVIETPPIDRLAIRTYVTRRDEGVMREAILRELERDGQVFFVYNRVETIEIMAQRLREVVPEARIGVAHGQMAEGVLEKVMSAFFSREIEVLVCSAIIESGIDVPKANTIIIDRADHFGLAQLYQLRGRVGRSYERAYAYLMIPGEQLISKDAQMRLRALQELDDLGGGFKLAAHDLEIRGAGNLLGKQQSGHITAVGYELYQQMMEDAVQELRGRKVGRVIEPEIQLGIPAYLPEAYIPDEGLRLAIYRRLAEVHSRREIDEIAEELRDRFGPIPPLADSFLQLMDLRRYLKTEMVVRAVLRKDAVSLQFHPEAPVSVDRLVELVQEGDGRFRLSADFQLTFQLHSLDWDGIVEETRNVLLQLRNREEVPA
jgi:transcription-repair coupling factor (superfamily II helicase)